MHDLLSILQTAGLGEKTAAVYCAACELGPSTAQMIAREAGVNRATTYSCLEELVRTGLVQTSDTGPKRKFLAAHPEQILSLVVQRRQVAEGIEAQIRGALPELLAHYNVEAGKPQVLFWEGQEGLHRFHDLLERLQGPYVQMTNLDDAREIFRGAEFARKGHQGRLKKSGTEGRTILVTKLSPDEVRLAPIPVDARLVPYEMLPIHGEVLVREDVVFLFSFRQGVLVTAIRNKTIAETLWALFDLAWRGTDMFPCKTAKERTTQGFDESW